ncbi:MAG TPA: glycosyltransferase family 1 protein [Candidatus Limnocylindria bacterium]|nr:glycosyltransferase family 1 protein [Candidatus Limnocylindria bacterium]
MSRPPRVLFLAPDTEDYLADSLLHGLRLVLGDHCVDWPKRDVLYETFPTEHRGALYGRGFTLYSGLLEDIEIDRVQALRRAQLGEFDLVVVGDVWRHWGWWSQLRGRVPKLAVLDGSDYPWPFPWSTQFLRHPAMWPRLPRRSRKVAYFKRELVRGRHMHPIAFSIPEQHVVATPPEKHELFGRHVVDPEVAARVGAATGYAFASQEEYFADLRAARFGITTKREGWDAMRHYEIAAAGAVPCVRDLARKPGSCAPHGLRDGVNCVAYTSAETLLSRVEAMPAVEYDRLQAGALAWARANTTRTRAQEFLSVLNVPA